MVFFVKTEDVGGRFDIVDDQRLSVLFGEQDVLFENLQLKSEGILVITVEAGLADGDDLVFFQEGFKFFN